MTCGSCRAARRRRAAPLRPAGSPPLSKALGWKTTIVDAKHDPNAATQQIRSPVAAKADAIVVDGFPCSWAPGALSAAQSAGVKVYGLNSFDCNASGDKKVYDGQSVYGVLSTTPSSLFLHDKVGAGIVNCVIAKTEGKGKVLAATTSLA
jgi:ribose transport system substrate-binding protein